MRKKTEELLLKRSRPLYKKKDLKILVNSKSLINTTNTNNIFKDISKFHTQECNNKNNIPQEIISIKEKEFGKGTLNRYNSSNKIMDSLINNENFDNNLSKRYKKINSQRIIKKYSMDNYKIEDMSITDNIEYYINKDSKPMNNSKSKNIKNSENNNPFFLKGNKNMINGFKKNVLQKNKDKKYPSSNHKNLLNNNFDAQYQDFDIYEEEKHIINNKKNKNKYNICINNPNFSPKLFFDYKKTSNLLSDNNTIENNKYNLFRKKKVYMGSNYYNNNVNNHYTSCKNITSKNAFDFQNNFSIKYNKKLINNEENNDDIPTKSKIYSFNINIPSKNSSNNLENLYYNPTISNENSYFNDNNFSNNQHNFKIENKNYFYTNEQHNKSSISNTFNCSYNTNNNSHMNSKKEKKNKISYEINLKGEKYASAINIFNNKGENELNEFKYNNFEKNNSNLINNINENKLQKIVNKPKNNNGNRKKVKRMYNSFNKINFNNLEKPKLCKTLSSNDLNDDIINYKKSKTNENIFNMKNDYYNNLKFLKQPIEEKKELTSDFHQNNILEENRKKKNNHKKGKAFCFNNISKTERLNHYKDNIMNKKRNSLRNTEENKDALNDECNIDNIINKYKNNNFLYSRKQKNPKLKNLLFIYERLFKRKNSSFKPKLYDNIDGYIFNEDKDDINYKKNKNQKNKIKYLTSNSTKNKDDSNSILDKTNNNKMYTLNYENSTRTNESNRRKLETRLENNEFIFNINQSKTLLSNIKYDNNSYIYTYSKMKSLIKNKNSESETHLDEQRNSKRLLNSNSQKTIDEKKFYDDFNGNNIEEDLNINENYFEQIKNEAKESYNKSNLEESDIANKENCYTKNSNEEINKEILNNIKRPIIINSNYEDDKNCILNFRNRVNFSRNNNIFDNKTINNCSFRHKNIKRNSNITENENDKEEGRKFSSVDNKEDFSIENNPDNLLLFAKCPKCHYLFEQKPNL